MDAARSNTLYDAELISYHEKTGMLCFRAQGAVHMVPTRHPNYWKIGTRGRLTLCREPAEFSFYPYPDQRLHRLPRLDDPSAHLWAWELGSSRYPILIKAGVIPGTNGRVIRENSEKISLNIPCEFVEFCRERKLTPVDVLRGFIGDLCELHNFVSHPREDGYGSHGNDERRLAREYFDRAYGWLADSDSSA